MNAPSSKIDEALSYAEGVLDRTALSIGVRTDAESEREFRSCIGMAMGSIRHAISSERSAEPQKPELSQAACDVFAERQRQISVEGWTPEHYDKHSEGELAYAAADYAVAASNQIQCMDKKMDDSTILDNDRTPQEPEVAASVMKSCDEIFQTSLAVRQMALNLGWQPAQLVVAQQILQLQPQTAFVQDCLVALEKALKGEDGLGNVLASIADGLLRLAAKLPFELERGPTKEAALEDAGRWFAGIQDRTPNEENPRAHKDR